MEDSDFVLALQLQELWEAEDKEAAAAAAACAEASPDPSPLRPLSVVDEAWELLDPSPDVHGLFVQFNETLFWGRLAAVEVSWSPRMTLYATVGGRGVRSEGGPRGEGTSSGLLPGSGRVGRGMRGGGRSPRAGRRRGSRSLPRSAAGWRSPASGFGSCRASEGAQQCAEAVSELSEEPVTRQVSNGLSHPIAVGFGEGQEKLSLVALCCS